MQIKTERPQRSYVGVLKQKGMETEEAVLGWLSKGAKRIIDFREYTPTQKLDVDFGYETQDGEILLLEIKSDRYVSETGNLFFETQRVNHFAEDHPQSLGWGWKTPAHKLIVRNPNSKETFVLDMQKLRSFMGRYVSRMGTQLRVMVVPTDQQKTTFGILVPMIELQKQNLYQKYIV